MNTKPNKVRFSLAALACCVIALVWAGCASQEQNRGTDWSAGEIEGAPPHQWHMHGQQQQQQQKRPVPAAKAITCTDPTWGIVRMTKTMPPEAAVGETFAVNFKLTAEECAGNVVVRETVPANATYVRSEPSASVDGAQVSWQVGDLQAGDSRDLVLWLKAEKEGAFVNCATVSAEPRVCATMHIVAHAVELTKSEPESVVMCDPIPIQLVVKNSGSSKLAGVKVTDTLPSGLTSDGKSTVVFEVGALAPGESKEFKFSATASAPGKYDNVAEVTCDQGISAKATGSTVVHQPVLAITCKATEHQYIERPIDVCLTLSNTGDVPAAGTKVTLPIPSGATFVSATAGGQVSGSSVVWDLNELAVSAPQQLCAKFSSTAAGTFTFAATASGTCAAQVNSSCSTTVVGVSALLLEKADNPDPIEIGETTTYTVKVTNQGSADDTNIKVSVDFPAEIDPVSASNGGVIEGKKVTFPDYPRLAPKQAFEFTVIGKGVKVGDARVTFSRTSDGIPHPTIAEESTRVY